MRAHSGMTVTVATRQGARTQHIFTRKAGRGPGWQTGIQTVVQDAGRARRSPSEQQARGPRGQAQRSCPAAARRERAGKTELQVEAYSPAAVGTVEPLKNLSRPNSLVRRRITLRGSKSLPLKASADASSLALISATIALARMRRSSSSIARPSSYPFFHASWSAARLAASSSLSELVLVWISSRPRRAASRVSVGAILRSVTVSDWKAGDWTYSR
mmetsp:Transcript_18072/g.46282  ORF Transcript_18072/g.46282 Transcript_18072/m.46282 type:complete len:216 (+) Transcript_18072:73-720(+)